MDNDTNPPIRDYDGEYHPCIVYCPYCDYDDQHPESHFYEDEYKATVFCRKCNRAYIINRSVCFQSIRMGRKARQSAKAKARKDAAK